MNLTFYSKTVPDNLDQGCLSSDKAQVRGSFKMFVINFALIVLSSLSFQVFFSWLLNIWVILLLFRYDPWDRNIRVLSSMMCIIFLAWSGYSLVFLLFTKISIVRRAHTYLPYICLHWSANHTWLVDDSSSPSVLAHLSHLSLYCPHLWGHCLLFIVLIFRATV